MMINLNDSYKNLICQKWHMCSLYKDMLSPYAHVMAIRRKGNRIRFAVKLGKEVKCLYEFVPGYLKSVTTCLESEQEVNRWVNFKITWAEIKNMIWLVMRWIR